MKGSRSPRPSCHRVRSARTTSKSTESAWPWSKARLDDGEFVSVGPAAFVTPRALWYEVRSRAPPRTTDRSPRQSRARPPIITGDDQRPRRLMGGLRACYACPAGSGRPARYRSRSRGADRCAPATWTTRRSGAAFGAQHQPADRRIGSPGLLASVIECADVMGS
jgi:hypothetical protein